MAVSRRIANSGPGSFVSLPENPATFGPSHFRWGECEVNVADARGRLGRAPRRATDAVTADRSRRIRPATVVVASEWARHRRGPRTRRETSTPLDRPRESLLA